MGQSRKRGSFEQRQAMARERDAIVGDMFAEKDHTATVVRDSLLLIPMTEERLESLRERSQRMIPG